MYSSVNLNFSKFNKKCNCWLLNNINISDVYSEGKGMSTCISNCHALIARAVILSILKSVRHMGHCVVGISLIVV